MANEQTSVPLYAASEVLTAANMNISAGTGVPVFATTVTRDAAFNGAGEKVLAEGQLCYLSASNIVQYYDGAAWATVGPSTAVQTAQFNETQSSGTDAGTATSGSWLKRVFNTTVINNITGCSIASSVITLPAGTYSVIGTLQNYATNGQQARLQNTTDATTTSISTNGNSGSTGGFITLLAYFTITGNKNFEFQNRVSLTGSGNGLGPSLAWGPETYATIQITKVA